MFAKAYIPLNQYVRLRLPGVAVGASVFTDAPETARGDHLVSKVQADSAKTTSAGILSQIPPYGGIFILQKSKIWRKLEKPYLNKC